MASSERNQQIFQNGDIRQTNGRMAARNRDRISCYLKGKSRPEPRHLKAIADALSMTVVELTPDIVADTTERENPEVSLVAVTGHEPNVFLRVNKLMPMSVAAEVITLISGVV